MKTNEENTKEILDLSSVNADLSDLLSLAVDAHKLTSFEPEKRGKRLIEDYQAELSEALATMPDEEKPQYINNYRKHLVVWLNAKGRTASPMITGPARFPVESNRKRMDTEQKRYDDFRAWKDRADKAIEKRIEKNKTPDEYQAEKWEAVEKDIRRSAQTIIDIKKGKLRGYDKALFVANLYNRIFTIAKHGDTQTVEKAVELVREINKAEGVAVMTERHSFFKLPEVSEGYRQKKEENATKENKEEEIKDGILLVHNYEADRLQIIFPDIPSQEIRQLLKKNGFHWSRYYGAWQRQLTGNAVWSFKNQILPKL